MSKTVNESDRKILLRYLCGTLQNEDRLQLENRLKNDCLLQQSLLVVQDEYKDFLERFFARQNPQNIANRSNLFEQNKKHFSSKCRSEFIPKRISWGNVQNSSLIPKKVSLKSGNVLSDDQRALTSPNADSFSSASQALSFWQTNNISHFDKNELSAKNDFIFNIDSEHNPLAKDESQPSKASESLEELTSALGTDLLQSESLQNESLKNDSLEIESNESLENESLPETSLSNAESVEAVSEIVETAPITDFPDANVTNSDFSSSLVRNSETSEAVLETNSLPSDLLQDEFLKDESLKNESLSENSLANAESVEPVPESIQKLQASEDSQSAETQSVQIESAETKLTETTEADEDYYLSKILGHAVTPQDREEYYWEDYIEEDSPSKRRFSAFLTRPIELVGHSALWITRTVQNKLLNPSSQMSRKEEMNRPLVKKRHGKPTDMAISIAAGIVIASVVVFPTLRFVGQEFMKVIVKSTVRKIGQNVILTSDQNSLDLIPLISDKILFPQYQTGEVNEKTPNKKKYVPPVINIDHGSQNEPLLFPLNEDSVLNNEESIPHLSNLPQNDLSY